MIQNFNIDSQPLWVLLLLHIAGAIAIYVAGRWLAGLAQSSIRVVMKRTRATPSLIEIIARGSYYVILVLAIFFALVMLGVPANILLGALGLIVLVAAVALQESLRDLAATVNFIVFQTFKVGDLIQTNGVLGQVQEILIFSTVMTSQDNQKIIIPNGNIQNSTLVNLSALDKVWIDLQVRLSYADGLQQVKEMLLEIVKADPRVLEAPAPLVQLMSLGDSQGEYMLRAYTTPRDSFFVRPEFNEQIKLRLEQRQISLPLPQLQVHGDPSPHFIQAASLPGNGQG